MQEPTLRATSYFDHHNLRDEVGLESAISMKNTEFLES